MDILKALATCGIGFCAALTATPAAACIPIWSNMYPAVNYTGTIYASQDVHLGPNSNIYSNNGLYKLTYQTDDNLVFYKSPSSVRWTANTQYCTPTPNIALTTVFQTDGNLVVYVTSVSGGAYPVWESGTDGHPNARLSVQDDGSLVIYDGTKVLWSKH